ncbi:MAG: MotA/TolQ/ExbB proton channel family protein [Planctomycetes bacterium]|nr:MotA/TolQ/ExbB proton channel family protein [Planctomycetota bacterium]
MRYIKSLVLVTLSSLCMAADTVSTSSELSQQESGSNWFGQLFGVGIWPLWILSVVLIMLIIERKKALRKEHIVDDAVIDSCIEALSNNDIDGAIAKAGTSPTRLCQAWVQGLMVFKRRREPLAGALTTTSALALKPLKRNVAAITTIGVIAPLLGLLGTVIGMIITFSQIEATGGADKGALAGGISVALFTTAGGLIIAIPAIVASRFFNNTLVQFAEHIELAINRADYCYDEAQERAQADGSDSSEKSDQGKAEKAEKEKTEGASV